MTGLKKGQTFWMDGHQWRVAYVNESRAHCVSEERVTVSVDSPKGPRTFTATRRRHADISPNAWVEGLE
jgi:cellulose synthase/poly-beta-1,6-N-acetylglucosamine synthase-like glycosyltransferase